jgi:hypothetical protein
MAIGYGILHDSASLRNLEKDAGLTYAFAGFPRLAGPKGADQAGRAESRLPVIGMGRAKGYFCSRPARSGAGIRIRSEGNPWRCGR